MDKMSVWSMLFVSFPEVLLIVIITLAAAGYIDVLNLKDKKNLMRLLLSSVLMVMSTAVWRVFLPSITLNLIVQLVIYYLIIVSVYRHKAIACILGFLLSMTIYIVNESILVVPLMKILDISLEQMYSSDILRILLSLPNRLSQIIFIIVICKIRNINLKMIKLKFSEWIQVVLFLLIILSSMISIESGIRNIDRNFETLLKLIINIGITVIFSFFMIFNILKLRKKIHIKENVHDVELHHIKQLIEEGKSAYAIELIDLTLREKGYYNQ